MDEKVLNRVRRLLAKAESTEFPDEATSLRKKAESLIITYGLEKALSTPVAQQGEITTIRINFQDPFSDRKAYLLHRVSDAFGCKSISFCPKGGRRRTYAKVVGYPGDLEQVELIYTSLLLQSARELAALPVVHQRYVRSERSGFLFGFAERAGERLEALYAKATEEAEDNAPGAALVLVDRKDAVDSAYAELFPNSKTGRTTTSSPNGYYAGRKSANNADLGQSRFGAGRQKALSAGG